jgi:DNA-directed RNA polymerase subunit H (RpoH/RPB5)
MKILEMRGYEVTAYNRFSPRDMQAMAVNLPAAGFTVSHKTEDRKCMVVYQQQRMTKKVLAILDKFDDSEGEPDYEKMDLIVLLTTEPVRDLHHQLALELWSEKKLRASFFCIYNIISNPIDHILVPKHERITQEEQEAVLAKVIHKSQLPAIRFHLDPIGRILGLVPGEIVKITRSSPSAGIYTVYRVCAP